MTVVAGILIILTVGLLWASKEEIPDRYETSAVTGPFYRLAIKVEKRLRKPVLPVELREKIFRKNEERFYLLNPAENAARQGREFFVEKCALIFLILFAGLALSGIIGLKENGESILTDGTGLERKEAGRGRYTVHLDAQTENGEYKNLEIVVSDRIYTPEEILDIREPFREQLEKEILGGNISADHISADMNLTESVKGYPFFIEWHSSERKILSPKGEIGEEVPAEGMLVMLEAICSYEDYTEINTFPVMVYPRELSAAEEMTDRILSAIEENAIKTQSEDILWLPEEVDGVKIAWTEKKSHNGLILAVLILISVVVIYRGKDVDLEKKVKEKQDQMLLDYPELISKYALLVGAGMTSRMAWKKLVTDHRDRNSEDGKDLKKEKEVRFVFEEMRYTLLEMESGVGELQAYQNFANRVRVQKYVKFVSLLEQNVKLGASGFINALQREAAEAMEERKSTAKRLGEEAGTKLLVPMMLMLLIVMVVIIVPAFTSI